MTNNDEFEKVIRKSDVMGHVLRKLLYWLTYIYFMLIFSNFWNIYELQFTLFSTSTQVQNPLQLNYMISDAVDQKRMCWSSWMFMASSEYKDFVHFHRNKYRQAFEK